jgi:hypothetical protein
MMPGRHIFFFCLLLSQSLLVQAQNHQVKFSSINAVGWLKGQSRSVVQFQSVNGLRYKTYFAGIGVGSDPYYFKTIPLFIELRKRIFKKPTTPFIYMDLGTNLPGEKDKVSGEWFFMKSEYEGALYYDLGLGYDFKFLKTTGLIVSLGYTEKRFTEKQSYQVDPGPSPNPTILHYRFKRISLKAGVRF